MLDAPLLGQLRITLGYHGHLMWISEDGGYECSRVLGRPIGISVHGVPAATDCGLLLTRLRMLLELLTGHQLQHVTVTHSCRTKGLPGAEGKHELIPCDLDLTSAYPS